MLNYESSKKIAAIVLGGGLKKIEVQGQIRYEPEAQAKARLDQAYTLFAEGKADYIISTGKYSVMATVDVDVTGPRTEAEVRKQYAKKLYLEPQGITSCILVTSDYHIERARIIFEWVLGPQYTIACVEAPSPLSGAERERRDQFEKMLTDHVKTHLISSIAAGDDEVLQRFMETEHQRMFSGIVPPQHTE